MDLQTPSAMDGSIARAPKNSGRNLPHKTKPGVLYSYKPPTALLLYLPGTEVPLSFHFRPRVATGSFIDTGVDTLTETNERIYISRFLASM